MEQSTSDKNILTFPVDLAAERGKPNVRDLNLTTPFTAHGLSFWMPVNCRFSVGTDTLVCFQLLPTTVGETPYPDVRYWILNNTSVKKDYYYRAREIDFTQAVGITLIPRLARVDDTGQVSHYFLEAFHQADNIRLVLKYPNPFTSAFFIDGVLIPKILPK
ncbi:MAG: hypothetical protein OEW58_06660 [Gammaproteobacteria bacterium]|nr:hypothetical protein [Gammaproteobacteria bacterium]